MASGIGILPLLAIGGLLPLATLALLIMSFVKVRRIEQLIMPPENWEKRNGRS